MSALKTLFLQVSEAWRSRHHESVLQDVKVMFIKSTAQNFVPRSGKTQIACHKTRFRSGYYFIVAYCIFQVLYNWE